jgi:hypothetical protein
MRIVEKRHFQVSISFGDAKDSEELHRFVL